MFNVNYEFFLLLYNLILEFLRYQLMYKICVIIQLRLNVSLGNTINKKIKIIKIL